MGNPNILSERYVTPPLNDIFSERGKILAERNLWIVVMKAQRELGVDIPSEDIEMYEAAREDVNLELIREIERKRKHDVKAKIEAFVIVSGAGEHIHKGMTSKDLTDNVEQKQIRNAAELIFGKYISVLRHFGERASEYSDIVLTARSHHQPAQPTLLGRRFSMWGEELYTHLQEFERFIETYPLRGIKGPVGTQFDMLRLLGSAEKVMALERRVAEELGFSQILDSPGQVYPRSLDQSLISRLGELCSSPQNYANTMRLMAGYELVTEGFKEGQVGSSAMPHKMNTRSSERIVGLGNLLKMYAVGAAMNAGNQWEEGDVSDSVVRRVVIPDSFYASDGLCETTLTVLNEMGAYPAIIDREVDRYLPFLASTELLMMAVQAGVGREEAYDVIKQYAVAEALRMRDVGSTENNLADLLAEDSLFSKAGITREKIQTILDDRVHFVGRAKDQISQVSERVKPFIESHSEQAAYEPRDIL